MSDLISRKEALSLLTNLQLNGGDLADAKRFVAVMPTAYDIDKVVRQLWKTSDCYSKSIGFCDDTNCFECRHCHLTLKQAIEIVKKGGVADET